MSSTTIRVFRGDGMTRVVKEPLLEGLMAALPLQLDGAPDNSPARWVYQQRRDEHLFQRRRVQDFRAESVRARRRRDIWTPGLEALSREASNRERAR